MSNSPLVSVIVPAYNNAEFLNECVNSVLAQTYRDIEVIIVDDESADGTAKIADDFAASDPRVKVIHKTNGGPSTARNAGIEIASGQFIAFVDGDDALHPKFVEIAMRELARTGADIFSSSYTEKFPFRNLNPKVKTYTLAPEAAIESVLYQQSKMRGSAWCHLYKIGIVKSERFDPRLVYEDLDYFYRVYERAKLIAHTKSQLYFYRENPTSILHTFNDKRLDVLSVVDRIEQHYSAIPALHRAAIDRKFSANFNMFVLCSRNSNNAASRCWLNIRKLRRSILFNPKSRLKNRFGALLSWLGPKVTIAISTLIYRTS